MRKDGLVVIFGPAMLFCHGFCPPLRKAKAMTIAIAGDNELISADRQIKKCTVQVIDLLQTVLTVFPSTVPRHASSPVRERRMPEVSPTSIHGSSI